MNENHDEKGRFSTGGGGSLKAAEKASFKAERKANAAQRSGSGRAQAEVSLRNAREAEYRAEVKDNARRSYGSFATQEARNYSTGADLERRANLERLGLPTRLLR